MQTRTNRAFLDTHTLIHASRPARRRTRALIKRLARRRARRTGRAVQAE